MAYPSVYPGSLDSYTVNTDGIDDVMAVDVNELQSAIVAIETKLGLTGYIHAAVADLAALRLAGATGRIRFYPYWDASVGSIIQAINTAEGAYVPLTLDGSVVLIRSSGLHVGGISDPGNDNLLVDGSIKASGVTTHGLCQQSIASLADHGKVQLGITAADAAIVFIQFANITAIYELDGSSHTVRELVDPTTLFTVTEDNDGTTNIYWDAGNSRYELNNETGTTFTYNVWLFRVD